MDPNVPQLLAQLADELRARRDDYRQGQFAGALRTLHALGEIDGQAWASLQRGLPEVTEDGRWLIDVDRGRFDWPTMPFQGRRLPQIVPTQPGTEPLLALILFDDGVAVQWHADHPSRDMSRDVACDLGDDVGTIYQLDSVRETQIGRGSSRSGVLGHAFFRPAVAHDAKVLTVKLQGRVIDIPRPDF